MAGRMLHFAAAARRRGAMKIKSPKDFWSGLMFLGVGLFFVVWAAIFHQAEDREQAAEQDRKIRRTHAHRRPHLVTNGGPADTAQPDTNNHAARPEDLRTLN